ncbi:MAG: hypothetical protein ACTHK0_02230 [Ginsengibacter sp.]
MLYNILFGQNGQANPGHPNIINFSSETYNASTQNWSVTQQTTFGSIAIANSSGVLFYNGSRWSLQPLPGGPIVRSVAAAPDGKVYAGAYGKAGYWDFSKSEGITHYVSLDTQIFGNGVRKEEIWKIIPTDEFVLFQTFNNVFLLYPNGRVQQLSPPNHFIFAHQLYNKIFIPVPGSGLYEIRNGQLISVADTPELSALRIRCMLPYDGTSMLLVAEKQGAWVFSGMKTLKKLGGNGGEWLASHSISFGLQLKNGKYLFGSYDGGAVIVNNMGELENQFDNATGLQSNTILEGMEDRDGNVWLVGDKGADLVVLNSPFRLYNAHTKFLDAVIWKNNIYFATNQGLLYQNYSDWKNGKGSYFSLVQDLKEFTWNTSVFDDQLIVGSASGTFLIKEDGHAKRVSSVAGGWVIQRLKTDSNYLIQGNYRGITLFKKNVRGEWSYFKDLLNDIHPIKELAQDDKGNIYFKHAYEGVYRCRLSSALQVEKLETPENLSIYNITPKNSLFEYNANVFITSENGILKWEDGENKIKPAPEIEKELGENTHSRKIIHYNNNVFWKLIKNRGDRFDYIIKGPGPEIKNRYSFFIHKFNLNYDFEKIKLLDENEYLFLGGNSLALFSMKNSFKENYLSYSPYFSQILFRDEDKWIEKRLESDSTIKVTSQFNFFVLRYAFPVFDRKVYYRYKLEGNNTSPNWSDWTSNSEREFLNMAPGSYHFTIQTDLVPNTISINIIVSPPWYWSIEAKIIYFAILCLAAFFLVHWYVRRLRAKHTKVMQQMSETLRQQQEQIEREQEKRKKEQLEMHLNAKAREAADSAMILIRKNEFLQKLKKDLIKIKESNEKNAAVYQSERLIKLIEKNMNDEHHEWMLFKSNFNQIHEQFYKKLIIQYPNLTANDLRFAAYLKMNLSSKEIAPLLNITIKTIELKRHRLRKKMNLSPNQNLTEIIMRC